MELSQIIIPFLLTLIAGLSTAVGAAIALQFKKFKQTYLNFALGLSTGVMVYVSFVELLPGAIIHLGFGLGNLAFFSGIIMIMLIDFFVPHQYIEERIGLEHQDKKLMKAGVFIAIGIAIHNFPEGLAVFMSGIGDIRLGITLAVAIAIHNIPEGIAVAMPIYYATKSRVKAFQFAFLSGIVEPFAALIGILFLLPFMTPNVISFMLAFVAGVMIYVSFDEILPICMKCEKSHVSVMGIVIGMAVMAISIFLL